MDVEERVKHAQKVVSELALEVTTKNNSPGHEMVDAQVAAKVAELFLWVNIAVEGMKR